MYFEVSLKGKERCKEAEAQHINNFIATHHRNFPLRYLVRASNVELPCSAVMTIPSAAVDLRNISTCRNLGSGLPLHRPPA